MADEEREEAMDEEQEEELAEETVQPEEAPQPAEPQKVRLNMEGVSPDYANFCTLTLRQGEVFFSFGKAFQPSNELKVDTQIVMNLQNVQQLYQALGRLLQQVSQQQAEQSQQ